MQLRFQNQQEREAFIVLSSINGIGRKTLKNLILTRIKTGISFGKILGKKLPFVYGKCLKKIQIDSIKNLILEQNIYSIIEHLKSDTILAITIFDSNYPRWLKETDDPPLVFYYRGDVGLLQSENWIAMVGTRRMTAYGNQSASYLAREFVTFGWGIVSGGMYGVDTASHQACIEAGGKTIAVLGYGFGAKVSRSAMELEKIILSSGGGLISEYTPGTPSRAGNFPVRNRIVAGLSQAVVVVEASEKSGSHITAQCGLDAGRIVGAVPGPITNPYSQGTKALINQGALCVSSAKDVLTELNCFAIDGVGKDPTSSASPDIPFSEKSLEKEIYDMLRTAPSSTDELNNQIKKPFSELMAGLTNLEISGMIVKTDTMWRIVL